ncbi:MAG: protein-export chaperone SecB [Bacteroidaceae bacterium]|nr:protein-export chaperone SecB [Bacteroidaceae bacterium]
MTKAAFSLEGYFFNKVNIDFDANTEDELQINFEPSGLFRQTESDSSYELKIVFSATDKNSQKRMVEIECHAMFRFATRIEFGEIPSYFYGNSIAIVFPYIRAFISTVTLQANFQPLVLPTMNLSSLADPLRENTTEA